MNIIRRAADLVKWRQSISPKKSIGFVPTMGALHRGHISLVKRSRLRDDLTVVSIFVNPTQFGPREDFSKYPRPWAKDQAMLAAEKVTVLFAPEAADIYPPGECTRVTVSGLTETLCGKSRGPQHFAGVATVVSKLFNLVRPSNAYFGLKDFQQVRVIEQLNRDLHFGIKIIRCPTEREKDGLALSSRNAYLTPLERQWAARIPLALQAGAKLLTSQPRMSLRLVQRKLQTELESIPNSKLDYVELVDPVTLKHTDSDSGPILLAAALFIGETRLIDNVLIHRP